MPPASQPLLGTACHAQLPTSARASFSTWCRMEIRYGDQDPMGHVNNAVYAQWIEAPRVLLLADCLGGVDGLDSVLARMTIDYLRETAFPGEVDVGGCLLRLGNRSVGTGFGVFRGDACLATAECVNVFFDTRARRSTDPPPAVRARIESALAAG